MYGVFDLLSDMGGLVDIFVIMFSLILKPYNRALSHFNSFKSLYTINTSLDSFHGFLLMRLSSYFKYSESTE